MAEDGIVGQYNGSQAREVIISLAQWEAMKAGGDADAVESKPAKEPRRNRIRRDEGWDNDGDSPRAHAGATTQLKKVEVVDQEQDEEEEADWEEEDVEEYEELDDED